MDSIIYNNRVKVQYRINRDYGRIDFEYSSRIVDNQISTYFYTFWSICVSSPRESL